MTERYRTIVADPPWDHSDGTGRSYGELHSGGGRKGRDRRTPLPYSALCLADLVALPIREMAETHAHLYLWTTNRYLRESYAVAEAWGFTVRQTLVWCKKPMGFFGKPFVGNSLEFCQYATRGSLETMDTVAGRWFQWPRSQHSAKPDAFLDIVERVSPGPYVELFARRDRLGWDTWGDQSLGTATLGEAA